MGFIRGGREYQMFKDGRKLTRKQAIRAMCYHCNGLEESQADCLGKRCPLYGYRLYPGKKMPLRLPEGTFKGVKK